MLQRVGIDLEQDEQDWLDHVLARLAAAVVPHEVVCPPVPLPRAHRLEELREALRRAGAKGTHAAVHYAFGLLERTNTFCPTARDSRPTAPGSG